MSTRTAIAILLNSGFQVTKNKKKIVYAYLVRRICTEQEIAEAIITLNRKKDYEFIREITDAVPPIF